MTIALIVTLLTSGLVAGCGAPREDRRLVGDEQTCQQMGHAAGTDVFKQCLADLNQRRCSTLPPQKGRGERHEATQDCTKR